MVTAVLITLFVLMLGGFWLAKRMDARLHHK